MTLACWGLQLLATVFQKQVLPRLPAVVATRISLPAPVNTGIHEE